MRDAMRTLRLLFTRALRLATPTIEQLAAGLGVSTSAVRRWRLGNRNVRPEVAGTLAKLLRRQARDLERVAAELDRFTVERGNRC
jgi:transcriptional regulator with XRE-family HTH domain